MKQNKIPNTSQKENKVPSKSNFLKILFILFGISLLIGFVAKSINVAILFFVFSYIIFNILFLVYLKNNNIKKPEWLNNGFSTKKKKSSNTRYGTDPRYRYLPGNSYYDRR